MSASPRGLWLRIRTIEPSLVILWVELIWATVRGVLIPTIDLRAMALDVLFEVASVVVVVGRLPSLRIQLASLSLIPFIVNRWLSI